MRLALSGLAVCLTLAVVPLSAQAQDWSKVERFPLGKVVAVTDDSGRVVRGHLLRADAQSLLLYAPLAEIKELKPLAHLAEAKPDLLSRADRVQIDIPDSKIRVSVDGVFKKDVRIAAFADVFQEMSRSSIDSVVEPRDQRLSALGIIGGAVAGAGVGYVAGTAIALYGGDHSSPKKQLGSAASLVGGPILGAMAGNALVKPKTDLVIYRR